MDFYSTRHSCSQTQFCIDMCKIVDWTDAKPNYDLLGADNMYLAYPSADRPDWPAFVAQVTLRTGIGVLRLLFTHNPHQK